MFTGAHFLLYSQDAEADRAFFRDVLAFPHVDAGRGWLIFGLPSAEAALHPVEGAGVALTAGPLLNAHLYLMCDDVRAAVAALAAKDVACGAIETAPWGIRTTIPLPSGGHVGLYQPTHPTALDLTRPDG